MITIMTSSRVSWSLGPVSDAAAFVEGLKTLIVSHDILRLKGFADIPGKPMRMVVQAVGSRIDTHFDRPWSGGETRQTRLVVIGLHDLDKTAIRTSLAALAG
jgi:cobalamin biosynthesis protein CobW